MSAPKTQEKGHTIRYFIITVCKGIDEYVDVMEGTSKYTEMQNLWNFVLNDKTLFMTKHDTLEKRKKRWRDKHSEEPYVNSRKNIDILCKMLRDKIDVMVKKAIGKTLKPDDVSWIFWLPADVRINVISVLLAENPLFIARLMRVSKQLMNDVKTSNHYILFREATFIANIASKIPKYSPVKLHCDLRERCIFLFSDFFRIALFQEGIQLSAILFRFMRLGEYFKEYEEKRDLLVDMLNDPDTKNRMDEKYKVLGELLAAAYRVIQEINKSQRYIIPFTINVTIDQFIINIMELYEASIMLKKILIKCSVDIENIEQESRLSDVGIRSSLKDYVQITGKNLVFRFIFWFLTETNYRDSFYINHSFIGQDGDYEDDESIPVLEKGPQHKRTVSAKYKDQVLQSSVLRSAYVPRYSPSVMGVIPATYYISTVTLVDMNALHEYISQPNNQDPWTLVYKEKRKSLVFIKDEVDSDTEEQEENYEEILEDGTKIEYMGSVSAFGDTDTKKYPADSRNFSLDLKNPVYGLYHSPFQFQDSTLDNKDQLKLFGILQMHDFVEDVPETHAGILLHNVVNSISQQIPILWVTKGKQGVDPVAIYRNCMFIMSDPNDRTKKWFDNINYILSDEMFAMVDNIKHTKLYYTKPALKKIIDEIPDHPLFEFKKRASRVLQFNRKRKLFQILALLLFLDNDSFFAIECPLLGTNADLPDYIKIPPEIEIDELDKSVPAVKQTFEPVFREVTPFSGPLRGPMTTLQAPPPPVKKHITYVKPTLFETMHIARVNQDGSVNIIPCTTLSFKRTLEYVKIETRSKNSVEQRMWNVEAPENYTDVNTFLARYSIPQPIYTCDANTLASYTTTKTSEAAPEADSNSTYWKAVREKQYNIQTIVNIQTGANTYLLSLLQEKNRYMTFANGMISTKDIYSLISVLPAHIVMDYAKLYLDAIVNARRTL